MKRFIIELLNPGIHRKAEMLPEQVEEKLFYERENEKSQRQIDDLKGFVSNIESRLNQEAADIRRRTIITSRTGTKLWLEVRRSKGLYAALHVEVYDLWRGDDYRVGEFYSLIHTDPIEVPPHLSLTNYQVRRKYQNQGIGQLIFQEAFNWLELYELTIENIRGNIAKCDDDDNHDRLAYLYQKLGATIDWYPEEKIVDCNVAKFCIPVPRKELITVVGK